MGSTINRGGATAMDNKAGAREGERRPLEVVDFLPLRAEFSVVPAGEGEYDFVCGKVPGAVASFSVEEADIDSIELARKAEAALRQRYGQLPGLVRWDEYPGGQATFVTGKVGGMLKAAELWGRPWPSAVEVAPALGYPEWLVALVIDEYRRQAAG